MSQQSAPQDLVVLSIAGVQRFISESRSTADLAAASKIIRQLAKAAAESLAVQGAELVFPNESVLPHPDPPVPNRIVALVDEGYGSRAAKIAEAAVREKWHEIVSRSIEATELVLSKRNGQASRMEVEEATLGFPDVRWASIGPRSTYLEQWKEAGRTIAALKPSHPFQQLGSGNGLRNVQICHLSPHWPALAQKPYRATKHAQGELSAANWTKNVFAKEDSNVAGDQDDILNFPSTRAIASAIVRQQLINDVIEGSMPQAKELLTLVQDLKKLAQRADRSLEASVGGLKWDRSGHGHEDVVEWLARGSAPWIDPEQWRRSRLDRHFPRHSLCDSEIKEGQSLAKNIKKYVTVFDSSYLAIVVQDIDSLGTQLSNGPQDNMDDVSEQWHQRVSKELSELALKYRDVLETPEYLATAVYSGGDDLLFLAPAGTAFEAAKAVNECVRETAGNLDLSMPTASTAILFFHHSTPFSGVVQMAQDLLHRAKARVVTKDSLGIMFLSRSGSSRTAILPWQIRSNESSITDVDESSTSNAITPTEKVYITEILSKFAKNDNRLVSPRLAAEVERDQRQLQALLVKNPDLYQAEIDRLICRHFGKQDGRPAELMVNLKYLTGALGNHRTGPPAVTDLIEALKLAHSIGQEAR